jgi:alpha-L-fucosidase
MKQSIRMLAAVGSLVGSLACHSHAQQAAVEGPGAQADRMTWWREARFGLFIHWGLYSVPARNAWLMNEEKIPVATYARYAEQFNPVKFNADEWVRMAKNAGMKYIVITAKHHEGFAMFKTEASPFNIVDATPFKRDPLKELADACEKEGLKLGFYYSQALDWHHPGGAVYGGPHDEAQKGDMTEYIRKIAQPQVKELLSNYGKVAIIWWDTPQDMNQERVDLMLEPLKLQPDIIQNNRMGNWYQGDFDTPEQNIPDAAPGRDWETCMTMNDSWGYNTEDQNWKSTKDLLRKLADIASKGGNFLLNVGPTAEGVIPEPSVERLAEIGTWMKVNGESIYGTSRSPLKELSWGRCTQKDGVLYLHVFDWPKDGRLAVPGLYSTITRAYLLADAGKARLDTSETEEGMVIAVGEKAPDENVSVVAVELQDGLVITSPLVTPAADGSMLLVPRNAKIHGNARIDTHAGVDNIGWWGDPACYVTWFCNVAQPGTYAVEITSSCLGEGGSEYTVSIGTESITSVVEGTVDWHTYTTKKIGVLSIPQAGVCEVVLKPLNNKSVGIMNLRSLRLTAVTSAAPVAADPAAKLARPTPEQIAWHECEIGMFIHFGPATWQDAEYDTLKTPLEKINPAQLDTEQWVEAAKAMGAKYIVFVAKHTGGFCWWQTDTSPYSVKHIPWRNGRGDVMKDLAASCRKHGIKLGVYLSPHDEQFGATGGGGRCATPEAQARYDKVYREQLTELLSRYGEMFEVWFDGSWARRWGTS